MRAIDDPRRIGRSIHVVATRSAVCVDINESRTHVAVTGIDHGRAYRNPNIGFRTGGNDPVVFHNDDAIWQKVRRQNHGTSKYYVLHIQDQPLVCSEATPA
jgi:hypothetical protein